MAIFYFINWKVAVETIEGGNYWREETILGNTVYYNWWWKTFSTKVTYTRHDLITLFMVVKNLRFWEDIVYGLPLTCLKCDRCEFKSNLMSSIIINCTAKLRGSMNRKMIDLLDTDDITYCVKIWRNNQGGFAQWG